MNSRKDIDKLLSTDEKALTAVKRRLSELPAERICSRKIKGTYRYYLRSKTSDGRIHESYLPNSKEQLTKECCEAAYLRKLIPTLEKEIEALKKFNVSYMPQEKINAWVNLPEGVKLLTRPIFKSNEQICRDWEYAAFEKNTFPISNPAQYVTKKNEIVRSRIELIVADVLYDLKIPYRYECKLELPQGIIYPDFTIMHPRTLEVFYIEIFGMMDNPEYEQAAFAKIAKYAASDIYSRLLMFFDHKNAPISPTNIKKTLEESFCR